ncbi:hypothetical protein FSP39_020377 [Pinctada imbricata]|uniref:Carbonic anhydrase n=2 Tax=Pinctada TaxID=50425 RepID=A0AA88XJ08_PINIB|nr:hypothetical protein FSP39_020377 [Pinctada imbricata]
MFFKKKYSYNVLDPKHVKDPEAAFIIAIRREIEKLNDVKIPSMSWGYDTNNGPATWCKDYPVANGKRQSPIDIVPNSVSQEPSLQNNPLRVTYKPEPDVDISNTGASVKVQMTQQSELTGGPLKGKYRLEQFHLHWGSENSKGSEHTVNGKMYPAELHLVHWNADKYSSFGEAADKSDGLAVLGYFVKIGKEHKGFKQITDHLKEITKTGSHSPSPGKFDPSCLVKDDISRYWTYEGSLTTPPLYESVTWIVFDDVMEISQEQLNGLRSIKNCENCCIQNNYRPPVPICDRSVKASFSGASKLK